MTNERRTPKREALLRPTTLEVRAYVVALLAAVYAITWRTIDNHAPASTATTPATEPEAQPRFVWIDSLPEANRPAIALPAEWRVASAPVATSPPPRVVRAPGHRVARVRTRSS